MNGKSLNSLANQLSDRRQGTAEVRRVLQVTARICGSDANATMEAARKEILRWMQRRAGRLPREAWEGNTFELRGLDAQPAEAVSLRDGAFWAARLDDADKNVPGRKWISEVGLGTSKGTKVLFGLRLTCVARRENPEYVPQTPGVILQLAQQLGLEDYGYSLTDQPWVLSTEGEVEQLLALLQNPLRTRPVFAVSLPEEALGVGGAVVDVGQLAKCCLGLAHVVVIPAGLTFALTDQVGASYSVFQGAIRTYRPGLDFNEDLPYRHPLALADRILSWPEGGPNGFLQFLVRQAAAESVRGRNVEEKLPSFAELKRRSLEDEFSETASQPGELREQITNAERQREAVVKELEEYRELAQTTVEDAEKERDEAKEKAERFGAENHKLRSRLLALEAQIRAAGNDLNDNIPLPDSYENMADWASEHLVGRLQLAPRAIRALKDAVYEDVEIVGRALLFLATEYRNSRIYGGDDYLQKKQHVLKQLGLEDSRSISENRAGEQGERYYLQWKGQREFLERHLTKGTAHDNRQCLRIYYFWDEDAREVIVGWLPSHLQNRIS